MSRVPRTIKQVTDRDAVLQAISEFDALGRETFIQLYGYGRAREYFISHRGKLYDSKAIIGVAFACQHKGAEPLRYNDFSGGEATVEPQLDALGFKIRHKRDLTAAERRKLAEREDDEPPPPTSPADAKRKVLALIARRLGQPKFRRALLKAYGERCAFTGDAVAQVLEAAHIEPYRLRGLNAISNGLLLRADIHTLFDLGLIAIDKANHILVSKLLNGSPYADMRGKILRTPKGAKQQPNASALEAHRLASKAG